jgi:hypothetical protein
VRTPKTKKQLIGEKKWTLFAPSETPQLYATRVPFEESSVWSGVCVRDPDVARQPLWRHASPLVAHVRRGDVLFVPRHWWHNVESLSDSVSINLWTEHVGDRRARMHEAVARLLIASLDTSMRACSSPDDASEPGANDDIDTRDHRPLSSSRPLINPTDECFPLDVNLDILSNALTEPSSTSSSSSPSLDIETFVDVLLSETTLSTITDQLLKKLNI